VRSQIFVVFGGQRTGSTLIATRLNSHPHIACYGEVLLPRVDSEPSLRGWLAAHGYPQFFRVIPALRRSFLDALVKAHQEHDVEAIGLKLMYEQVSLAPKIAYAYPPVGRLLNDVGMLRWLEDHDALIIHALRRNHLKTVVSHVKATQTREFHRHVASRPSDSVQIILPLRGLKARLNRIDVAQRVARDSIKGLRTIEVWYEDYTGDLRGYLEKRILAELGQTVPVRGLQSPLVKVTRDDLHEVLANYDQVANLLAGTRFERFLKPQPTG
jgi:LPS sulfotransferase NodH